MRGLKRLLKKERIQEFFIAKGNDTRTFPEGGYPVARFRLTSVSATTNLKPDNLDFLDVRFVVKQEGAELNSNIGRHDIAVSNPYISDNQNRSHYPNGFLDFYLKVPRWQINNIWAMDWQYGAEEIRYLVTEIDVSKLRNVRYIRTADNGQLTAKVDSLNLSNAKELRWLEINRNRLTELDITDNENLEYLFISDNTNGLLETVITNGTNFEALSVISLTSNDLKSFNISAPNLKTLTLANNTALGNVDLSNFTELESLNLANCGITSIDLSSNTKLKQLVLGGGGGNANNNSIGNNIIGLEDLSSLTRLRISRAGITIGTIDMDLYPDLVELDVSRNGGIHTLKITNVNLNLKILDIRSGTGVVDIEPDYYPNLEDLRFNDMSSYNLNQFDLTKLKKLRQVFCTNVYANESVTPMVLYDFSQNEFPISINIRNNHVVRELRFPPIGSITDSLDSMLNLETVTGLNSISRSNTTFYFLDNNLSELNTDFGGASCFPNVVGLGLGGHTSTYTQTAVYDHRKNNLTTFIVRGNYFKVDGNIGTDTLASATLINVEGDSNLSYAVSASFPSNMRRVFLRPNLISGLATDGGQVSNLIIDLSTKNWSSGSIGIAFQVYSYRVIDLRGNCATPTPSPELTTALNLLNSKGVTVLTN